MDGPLKGIRVVEVAIWAAGPATGAVLGDWGADVIKLEDPKGGDPIRSLTAPTLSNPSAVVHAAHELDNRNKRSVAIDLRRPEGLEFAMRLVERCDVFLTNLKLDALERLKLDYSSLAARNPRLIYATLNGYGHRGPDRLRPGFDYAAGWARSGLMAMVAEPGKPPPGQRPAMIDQPTGLALAGAIAAALLAREKTGRGREVRLSLYAMGLWMNSFDLTVAAMSGCSPQPESREARPNAMWNSYQCKDGRWIYFVMIQVERFWPVFCAALGRTEWLENPRYRDVESRASNSRELIAEVESVVASRTLAQWAPVWDEHGLIWAPVQNLSDVLEDPQAHAIGAFAPVAHPQISDCRVVKSPVEFGGFETTPYAAAPELGQHTEEVALELGLSWEQIALLKESGALG